MTDRSIRWKFLGDAAGLSKASGDAEKGLGKVGDGANKVAGIVKTAMAVVATGAVARFGKELLDHGAVMAANERKASQVFGSWEGTVARWAKSNAKDMGQSENAVIGLAGSIGDLLVPLGVTREEASKMSMEAVEVGDALSAWSGGAFDTAEASEDITKALLGEREALKKYGIAISEADVQTRLAEKGQKDLEGSALAAAKATATLEIITEKSADAISAYAENADPAYVAQQRMQAATMELKDSLTRNLLPALSGGAEGFTNLLGGAQLTIEWFSKLPGPAKAAAIGITGIGTALVFFGNKLKAFIVGSPLQAGVIAGLAAIGAAVAFLGKNAAENAEQVQGMADALIELGTDADLSEQALASLGKGGVKVLGELGLTTQELLDIMASAKDHHEVVDLIREMGAEQGIATGETMALTDGIEHLMKQTKDARLEMMKANTETRMARTQATGYDAVLKLMGQGMAKAGTQAGDMAESVEELADETDEAASAGDRLRESAKRLTDPLYNAQKAAEALEEANRNVIKAEKDHGKSSKEYRRAIQDAAKATLEAEAAMNDLDDADLSKVANEMHEAATISREMRDAIVSNAKVARSELQKGGKFTIDVVAKVHPNARKYAGGFDKRAGGGPVGAGQTFVVGEQGPELLTMGTQGRVTPNHQAGRGGGGTTITINVTAGIGTDGAQVGRKIVEALQAYQRSNGALPVAVRG